MVKTRLNDNKELFITVNEPTTDKIGLIKRLASVKSGNKLRDMGMKGSGRSSPPPS